MRWIVVLLIAVSAAGSASAASTEGGLWTVRPDGRGRALVSVLPDGQVLDRTDAGRLAVRTDAGIALEDADGANRVLVPRTTYAYTATFSPDGATLLFSTPSPDGSWATVPSAWTLSTVASDGTRERTVASGAGMGAWSRDGRSIVYGAADGSVDTVPNGGGTRHVLAHGVVALGFDEPPPALSPDGRSVAFECRNAAGGTLCVTRAGHTARFAHAGWEPMWSPDGRRIATWIAGNLNQGLGIVDVPRRRVQVVAMPDLRGVEYRPLAWSPDGRRLAYQRRCTGLPDALCATTAWTRDVATGARTRISVDGLGWSLVHWRGDALTYVTGY